MMKAENPVDRMFLSGQISGHWKFACMFQSPFFSEAEKYWTALWNPHKQSCSGSACDEVLDWLGQKDWVFEEWGIPSSLSLSGEEVGRCGHHCPTNITSVNFSDGLF